MWMGGVGWVGSETEVLKEGACKDDGPLHGGWHCSWVGGGNVGGVGAWRWVGVGRLFVNL